MSFGDIFVLGRMNPAHMGNAALAIKCQIMDLVSIEEALQLETILWSEYEGKRAKPNTVHKGNAKQEIRSCYELLGQLSILTST